MLTALIVACTLALLATAGLFVYRSQYKYAEYLISLYDLRWEKDSQALKIRDKDATQYFNNYMQLIKQHAELELHFSLFVLEMYNQGYVEVSPAVYEILLAGIVRSRNMIEYTEGVLKNGVSRLAQDSSPE